MDGYLGAEGARDVLEPLESLLGDGALGQQGPAPLGDGASVPHVDRVQHDLAEFTSSVVADCHHALPKDRVASEGPRTTAGARIEVVARCLVVAQLEAAVGFVRHPEHAFVLEDEVAQAVENGAVLVYLDTPQEVGTVASEQGTTLVYGPVSELH